MLQHTHVVGAFGQQLATCFQNRGPLASIEIFSGACALPYLSIQIAQAHFDCLHMLAEERMLAPNPLIHCLVFATPPCKRVGCRLDLCDQLVHLSLDCLEARQRFFLGQRKPLQQTAKNRYAGRCIVQGIQVELLCGNHDLV